MPFLISLEVNSNVVTTNIIDCICFSKGIQDQKIGAFSDSDVFSQMRTAFAEQIVVSTCLSEGVLSSDKQ